MFILRIRSLHPAARMRTIHTASELKPEGRKVCLAIGFFDGVHLGHQQIIQQTTADAYHHEALSLVVTFDRHPNTVVAPQRVPPLIYSLSQRLRVIERMGCDALLLLHFDKAFSQQSGDAFIRDLARDLGQIQSLCVGSTFTFGHKRSGNVALLKTLGTELNFTVHGMAAVSLDGKIVSSTRIRETIRAGDLDAASQMLGRPYSISGRVLRGDQLGHQLGFPTANIDATGLVLPPNGVYAAHALVRLTSNAPRTTSYIQARAAVNIGYRPTLKNPMPELRVEAHLLDYKGDLYEQDMEIVLVDKLRDEQKFPSLEALKEQIAKDVAAARKRF
jgi:riboflavin kinase / FMN adenylyltransferase